MKITHSMGGFGSCSTVALLDIIEYYNEHGKSPEVDRTAQYQHYAYPEGTDLIPVLFASCDFGIQGGNIPMPDHWALQWESYKGIPFQSLMPFILKVLPPV